MKDPSGVNQELIEANSALKQRIEELEQAEAKHKQCEEQLRSYKETLQLCIEYSPAAIAMFDREMKYIAASRRYLIDYGLGEQSLVGRSHYDVFPELPDRWEEVHRRCLAGSIEKADEGPFSRADGRIDWVRWEIRPWNESGGRIGGIILFSEVITEHKRVEEALKEEVIRRRILVEQSRDGIVVLDQNGKVYEANRRYADLLGYSMEEVLQLHVWDWDTQWSREQLMEMIRTVDETGNHFETRHRRKDGTSYDVEVSTNGAMSGGRKLIFAVCRDITDRKRTEAALIKNEEKFRKAFYTSPDSVNINRLEDGMYISINPGFTRTMEYTEEDIIGKTSIEYNIWENIEDRQRLVDGLRKDGEVTNLEAVFRTKSGGIRYGLMSASVIDLDGVPHILSITRDITDRKRVHDALRESEKQYRLLADNVNDVIFVLDMNLNYTYVSPSVKILRGYEPAEVLKQPGIETATPSSWDLAMRNLSEVMEREQSGQGEIFISRTLPLEMVRKDGTTVWAEVKFSFIRDEKQRPLGILGVTRDITERKQAEDQIHRLNAELEQRVIDRTAQLEIANKELEAFSYSVSHDLKAPLRAIEGYAQILIEDHAVRLDDEGRRTCEVISNNVLKMGRLIDALLALSRTGRKEMNSKTIDMATMANEVLFDLTTPEKRERIDFRIASLPWAMGDPQLLRQVWMNLIGNAVKFSAQKERAVIEVGCLSEANGHPPAGGHEADVSTEHLRPPPAIPIPDSKRVYFVRDNGAGFDMTYVDKLFGVFQRLHSAKEFEGTGAGLAIVKRIIQRHGGRIWAEGEVGKGATFYFSIG
ncbi:MAG: PAS domain S-box protein [Syntrophales bacterium]|jgi:PAS domain S-box-containing protein